MMPNQGRNRGRSPQPNGWDRRTAERPAGAWRGRGPGRRLLPGILGLLLLFTAGPAAATCPGDCDGDGRITRAELRLGTAIRRGRLPLETCASFDTDLDGRLSRDELRQAVRLRRRGCPAGGGAALAGSLSLHVDNPAARPLVAVLSGKRLHGPPTGGAGETYGPLVREIPAGGARLTVAADLAGGEWLHSISVPSTGQRQARRGLLPGGATSTHGWSLYATVLEVNRSEDDGDGVCDDTCTLRDAVGTASRRDGPVLIRLPHRAPRRPKAIEITREEPLLLDSPGLTIDGTDAGGNPSALDDFDARFYPSAIVLRTGSAAANPDGPCGAGGVLRVRAAGVRLIGLSIERRLAPEGTLCRGDQDIVAFDAGSRGSGLEVSRLDGGAHRVRSAEVPSGVTLPATGKDCVDASGSGAGASDAVGIDDSEIRFCLDRGVKSQSGWLRIRRSWIHHNLRGGLFAQSPVGGAVRGVIEASDSLIERNGLNCPSGDPRDCGPEEAVAREGAAEISAQGALTAILSDGNVVREGAVHGFLFESGSTGAVRDSYVCGINNSAGGKGILSQRATGRREDVSLRGTAVVYNDDAGVKVRRTVGIDLGAGADGGGNAFTQNGRSARRNVVNILDAPTPVLAAAGNSWEHCYGADSDADRCDFATICARDANNSSGTVDRVDPHEPLPHQGSGGVEVFGTLPSLAPAGGVVRLSGRGFDAISGHEGGVDGDCRGLARLNTCAPLRGTCVEFLVDGEWRPASDVLAVTPTTVVVRTPFACTQPTWVRARRRVASGGEVASEPVRFCVPG